MEVLLVVISILLIAGGIIFSVLPPLPGPILSYGALVSAHYISQTTNFSSTSFIIWGLLCVLIIIGDYALPIAATKKFGGTRSGVIGGMIGTIAGVILPIPFGIVVGPLLGAIIGDLYGGNRIKDAMKSGFGSFLGFLVATGVKVLYSVILGCVIAWKVGSFTFERISQYF